MNLVTGGTGLVGAHLLLHLLQNGETVRALYRTQESIQKTKDLFGQYNQLSLFDSIEWVPGNVNDIPALEAAFQNISYVYHSAALISFDPKDEEKLRKINIEGTANMVNCALSFGVKKLCHVSSIAALGDLAGNETEITETTEWNPEKPHSDYALSKYGAEMEIWRGYQEGLACVIVNPGVILGPGFWDTGSGSVFRIAFKGMPFYTKGSTGYIAVADVVKIMHRLLQADVTGERFALVAENVSFEELLEWISEIYSVKKPALLIQPWITGILWRLDRVLSKILFKKTHFPRAYAKSLHTTDRYANAKIKTVLDFEFQPIKSYCKEVATLFLKR